jgi:cytochrome P450
MDPSFYGDPYPVYRRLREEQPVYWSDGLQAWLISRHVDVAGLLKDTARLSNFGWERRHLDRLDSETKARIPELLLHCETSSILTSDPPLHTRLRKSVIKGFTPTAIERLRPRVDELVNQFLDRRPGDTFDLIATLAYPLPATVVAELLGVPAEDREDFKRWSVSLTTFFGSPRPDPDLARRTNDDLVDFRRYLRALIADRRAAPQEDVASVFAADGDDGLGLSDEEAVATMAAFLVAGHETTTNVIGNGMLALLGNPAAMDAMRSGAAPAEAVVEETLRYDAPVQRVRRTATEDFELYGRTIRSGSTVMLLIGSANRDPDAHQEPDVFDVARPSSSHLAFGLGPHYCIGAGLARLEAPIAIRAIGAIASDIRPAPGWRAEWNPSMTLRGLRTLDVRLTA